MNIYEYQAKEILRKHGVKVPRGKVASDPLGAEYIAKEIGGTAWVIKAQIHAGGRGKAGGIRFAKSLGEVKQYTKEVLGTSLKTYQSGDSAKNVNKVLVEEMCDIAKELYFAATVDRLRSKVVIIASSQGGVEIEETARKNPSAIFKEYVDPVTGMMPFQARNLAFNLELEDKDIVRTAIRFMLSFYALFIECDCALAEINPLVITKKDEIIALDAKLSFDDSALSRHPEIAELRDLKEELPSERIARENNLSYVGLEGNIGCMVNGAGLAMATMDCIKLYGGEPANFLDVGGGASAETVTKAFNILMSDDKVKVILVNIFGGILKCDVLAEGIVRACQEVKPHVPLVVRLEGTNVERGREILNASGLNIISESDMKAAAQKAVELAE
ncbi:ADP-forming succinate--CoA ligase subunit beta [bacterium]|nr:ADP-forming succinate--CoA ligase subunit beta [bacterium]